MEGMDVNRFRRNVETTPGERLPAVGVYVVEMRLVKYGILMA